MSHVVAIPDGFAAAATATDPEGIGWALITANEAAAVAMTGLLAAGADEVLAGAALFAGYARDYQALSTQVAGFYQRFVTALTAAAGSYAAAEGSMLLRCG